MGVCEGARATAWGARASEPNGAPQGREAVVGRARLQGSPRGGWRCGVRMTHHTRSNGECPRPLHHTVHPSSWASRSQHIHRNLRGSHSTQPHQINCGSNYHCKDWYTQETKKVKVPLRRTAIPGTGRRASPIATGSCAPAPLPTAFLFPSQHDTID